MTSPQVPEPSGSAYFAVDMPADDRAFEAHTSRIVRMLKGHGYNVLLLDRDQVIEAGAIALQAALHEQEQT